MVRVGVLGFISLNPTYQNRWVSAILAFPSYMVGNDTCAVAKRWISFAIVANK